MLWLESTLLFRRIVMMGFAGMLLAFTPLSVYAQASADHALHEPSSEQMMPDMIHEHVRDCAAACGVTTRSEPRRVAVKQVKQQPAESPRGLVSLSSIHEQDPNPKHLRTVVIQSDTNLFMESALLRI